MKNVLIFFCFLSIYNYAQLSPGELSFPHQKLDGIKNCTECHLLGKGLSKQKCLNCHNEIKIRIDNSKGYHSSAEVRRKNCWDCHSEHNGREFRIINFNEKDFNHSKTGFQLTGKHISIQCRTCHNPKYFTDKNIKKEKTFLGLSQDCKSCHKDVHYNTTKENCNTCHNTENFNSTLYYDHSKTEFPLIGSHKNISCIKCHLKENSTGETKLLFTKIKSSSCDNCHSDVHKGRFGKDCLRCHYFESFSKTNLKNFNHSLTNFQLKGSHIQVNCSRCHKEGLTKKLKFDKCNDCHNDFHDGQLNKYSDCRDCHNEFGFRPSTFTTERHSKTNFQLTGSHLAIECSKCHISNNNWNFVFEKISCQTCHKNVHNDEIINHNFNEDLCLNCHNTSLWNSVSFNHNLTKFKLEGKHQLVKCKSCHFKEDKTENKWLFKSLSGECVNCHLDNHNKQFASDKCTSCHYFENWVPIYFDHDKANFNLEGAHKKVVCEKCHQQTTDNEGRKYFLYKSGKRKCSDCHS